MIQQTYADIVTPDLAKGALIHDVFTGFKEDYLCLHSLLRKYNPATICEIGTNTGNGVNVMATACPLAKIYSLDLDYETMKQNSKQYPIGSKGEDRVGTAARFPYVQLRGDSMTFDFGQYPCEAYYCDGEHSAENVRHETVEMLKCKPKIIIYHDTDLAEVMQGLLEGLEIADNSKDYQLYRIIDTRVSYLLKKEYA